MWKEYNRQNKRIRKRWRSRYKNHKRGNATKYKLMGLIIALGALLLLLMVYAGSCIWDLSRQDEKLAANMGVISSVEIKPVQSPAPTATPEPEEHRTIVALDAGHGGKDGGTFNDVVIEKDVNLGIVKFIYEILLENEIEVVLTRSGDELVELQERTAAANDGGADLFVSIHCNYFEDDAAVSGLECYYCPGKEESGRLADKIVEVLKKTDKIKVRSAKEAEYYVLKHTDMPAVLVEVGFLSNREESQKLNSEEYRKILAQGIADAIMKNLDEMAETENK